MNKRKTVPALVLLLFTAVSCQGEKQTVAGRHSELIKKEAPALNRRLERIQEEISLGDHEWAGIYRNGNPFGDVFVALAPQSGVAYKKWGCTGLYDMNHGEVISVKRDSIKLRLVLDPTEFPFKSFEPELFRVRWGARHYLVPRGQMMEFCNDVNSGREPGTAFDGDCGSYHHFLRRRDLSKPADGMPEVPDEFKRYLLPQPIITKITRIIGNRTTPNAGNLYEVEIDAGADKGLQPKMELALVPDYDRFWDLDAAHWSWNTCWDVKVTSVNSKSSVVQIANYDTEASNAPEIGDELSSRHWINGRITSSSPDSTASDRL